MSDSVALWVMLTNGDDDICIRGVLSPGNHLFHFANQLVDGLQTVLGLQAPINLSDSSRNTYLLICTEAIKSSLHFIITAQD